MCGLLGCPVRRRSCSLANWFTVVNQEKTLSFLLFARKQKVTKILTWSRPRFCSIEPDEFLKTRNGWVLATSSKIGCMGYLQANHMELMTSSHLSGRPWSSQYEAREIIQEMNWQHTMKKERLEKRRKEEDDNLQWDRNYFRKLEEMSGEYACPIPEQGTSI